jgi:hypothetical protein
VSPDGNEPELTIQVNGEEPPDAANVAEYGDVAVPGGNVVVVMVGPNEISIESCFDAVAPTLSVTRNVTSEFPITVGVPLMFPVLAFKDKPVGSEPEVMVQLSGAVPPVLAMVCE